MRTRQGFCPILRLGGLMSIMNKWCIGIHCVTESMQMPHHLQRLRDVASSRWADYSQDLLREMPLAVKALWLASLPMQALQRTYFHGLKCNPAALPLCRSHLCRSHCWRWRMHQLHLCQRRWHRRARHRSLNSCVLKCQAVMRRNLLQLP